MPVLKISLTEEEYSQIFELAKKESLSVQDYIRYLVLGKKNPAKFTPEEAERRAVEKFTDEDEPFSLPQIYDGEWQELNPRMTGVFGKRVYNFFKTSDVVEFAGMTPDGRRATYRIKKEG